VELLVVEDGFGHVKRQCIKRVLHWLFA
jgi:hypothetical protein